MEKFFKAIIGNGKVIHLFEVHTRPDGTKTSTPLCTQQTSNSKITKVTDKHITCRKCLKTSNM